MNSNVRTCDASEQFKNNNNLFSLGDVTLTKTVSGQYKGTFTDEPAEENIV
jgi:hypothetical protein